MSLIWTLADAVGIVLLLWVAWLAYRRFQPAPIDPLRTPLPVHVLAVRPYIAVDVLSGERGPTGCFLNGTMTNTNGTAVKVRLKLPGLPLTQSGELPTGFTERFRYRWDPFAPNAFSGRAFVEFTDTFGNIFRQEGTVTTPALPSGAAHGYVLSQFGAANSIAEYTQ
jgi:hypothetical protein